MKGFRSQVKLRVRTGTKLAGIVPVEKNTLSNYQYLKLLNNIIPDGRVSHWKVDEDSVLGNILIPDTIRQEIDSEYGALLSVSSSEVNANRFIQRPSLFRAICMNGCIWGSEKGNALTSTHLGRATWNEAAKLIEANLIEQIPLCCEQVEKLLATRELSATSTMKPLIARVCKDHRLTKTQSSAVLRGWNIERNHFPDVAHTLFGVLNGVTRGAQDLEATDWRKLDELGGKLLDYTPDRWNSTVSKSLQLDTKQVEKTFAPWQSQSA